MKELEEALIKTIDRRIKFLMLTGFAVDDLNELIDERVEEKVQELLSEQIIPEIDKELGKIHYRKSEQRS